MNPDIMPDENTPQEETQPNEQEQLIMFLTSIEDKLSALEGRIQALEQSHTTHLAESDTKHQAHTQAIQASKKEVTDALKGEIAKHLYESS